MKWLAVAVPMMLAACSSGSGEPTKPLPPDLEAAAVERGLVRDPADRDVTGVYARDTDRLCVVKQGGRFRIGALVDYGEGLNCSGEGTARRSGGTLSIELKGGRGDSCAFEARFDGERISFPANLPDGCAKLCGNTASLAALDVERLSESAAEAAALRTPDGNRPCGD